MTDPQQTIKEIFVYEKKYTKYLFGGKNEKGLIKGKLINDILGYNIDNYLDFDKLLKDNIAFFPSVYKGTNNYGDRYEGNMVLRGLKGRQAKLTIGVLFKTDKYKLTSVYINKLKDSELEYDYYE